MYANSFVSFMFVKYTVKDNRALLIMSKKNCYLTYATSVITSSIIEVANVVYRYR